MNFIRRRHGILLKNLLVSFNLAKYLILTILIVIIVNNYDTAAIVLFWIIDNGV